KRRHETMNVLKWIETGKHLPRFLRDFHDQKDLFKTIEQEWGQPADKHYAVGWVAAQCYVIDRFLRFMALHGYTLQRTRTRVECYDLRETLKQAEEERQRQYAEELKRWKAERIPAKAP